MEKTPEKRCGKVKEIKSYLTNVEKEVSDIFRELQWDMKQILERPEMVLCAYNKNHRITISSREAHEQRCLLAMHGYSKEDRMLSEGYNSETSIKLNKYQIQDIVNKAARNNPQFGRDYLLRCLLLLYCLGNNGIHTNDILEPLTLDRLQATYTPDERRAIHDAVVAAAPRHNDDFTDLPLPSSSDDSSGRVKSRAEVLAELRDMKRRRAKYRVASRSSNYSDALRDLISSQMELYTGSIRGTPQTENIINPSVIKQEKPDGNTAKDLKTTDHIESKQIEETNYDRSIDRNILYRRDRSRSRSQERRKYSKEFFPKDAKSRYESQKVKSPSRTRDIKQEDTGRNSSKQRFHERFPSNGSNSKRTSKDRSRDRDYKREGSKETSKSKIDSTGSKSRSKDEYRSRHREGSESRVSRYRDDSVRIKEREIYNSRDRHRRRDDRRSSSSYGSRYD